MVRGVAFEETFRHLRKFQHKGEFSEWRVQMAKISKANISLSKYWLCLFCYQTALILCLLGIFAEPSVPTEAHDAKHGLAEDAAVHL